jgi:hypothetical protein
VYDIVDGLIFVAEKGEGDNYGIGADTSYSVLDVAAMFGSEVVMMPERKGNRLTSGVDNDKLKALGWSPKRTLPQWIEQVKQEVGSVEKTDQRVLVFSTTYFPHAGHAEEALFDVMKALPKVQFDVITAKFSGTPPDPIQDLPNVTVHRLGRGTPKDKYLLPFLGARLTTRLKQKHSYVFAWSLFASYAALAATCSGGQRLPQLVTLADQRIGNVPWPVRFLSKRTLSSADQIYALDTYEAQAAVSLGKRTTLIRSIGQGDAFANQIRIAYTTFLRKRLK